MKRWIYILFCLILCLALPACRTESDEAWEALMGIPGPESATSPMHAGMDAPTGEGELHGSLTVSQLVTSSDDPISSLAMEFMRIHPGVKITFENFATGEDFVGKTDAQINEIKEKYQTQLNMKLVTGEAADILIRVDGLSLYNLAHSGILRDMRPDWERDMDPADFWGPIVDLAVIDEKMCMVPFTFRANMIYINKRVSDKLGLDLSSRVFVRTNEILDWYNQARDQGILAEDAPVFFDQSGDAFDELFALESSRYIDWDNRAPAFASPECVRYLEALGAVPSGIADQDYINTSSPAVINELIRCRATGEKTQVTNDPFSGGFAMQLDYVEKAREGFCVWENLYEVILRDAANSPCDYLEGPFFLANSAGQVPITFRDELAITSGCRNPELAWEFIKFCVSSRETNKLMNGYSYSGGDGVSINRHNAGLSAAETRLNWGGNNLYNNLGWYWEKDVPAEEMLCALDSLLDAPLINSKLYTMEDVNGYLDEFLVHRLTTAEQCAQKLQEQAYIWLNE